MQKEKDIELEECIQWIEEDIHSKGYSDVYTMMRISVTEYP